MTEPQPPIDDALVSAVLDGEATPDERALVEASPEARRRLAELRAVAGRIGEPVASLSPSTIDRLVAGALESGTSDSRGAGSPAGVVPIDDARHRRSGRRRHRWGAVVAGAAAAVLLLGGFVAVLRSAGSGSSSDSASSAADTVVGGSASASQSPEAANTDSAADAGAAPIDLGPQATAALALDALEGLKGLDQEPARAPFPPNEQQFGTGATTTSSPSCPLPPDPALGSGPWRATAFALLPTGPVTIAVDTSDPDRTRAIVVDDATCTVLLDRPA